MQPGDPFATKALDEQRARHRRILRSIEAWLIREVIGQRRMPPQMPDPDDRGIVEERLRAHADELLPNHSELLVAIAEPLEAKALHEFLNRNTGEGRWIDNPLRALAEYARSKVRDHKDHIDTPEQGEWIQQVVLTLVWADELAGDYRDPRLVKLLEERAA